VQEEVWWTVIEEFDKSRDDSNNDNNNENSYEIHIPPRVVTILSTFRNGQEISTNSIQTSQKNSHSKKKITSKTSIRLSISIAKQIKLIQKKPKDGNIVEYTEFCKIPPINYWRKQLNETNLKNVKHIEKRGTRGQYSYKLLRFHNWLKGRTFKIKRLVKISEDSFQIKVEDVTFTGVDHMLQLVEEENSNSKIFVKIIKEFLLDPTHKENGTSACILHSAAIKSFFSLHDTDLTFKFNAKAQYEKNDTDDEDVPLFSLSDFFDVLTIGKPSLTEKAVFLCKFQRGLDGITFADRFNFSIFGKLVKIFGSVDHNNWDISKCPVLIELVRIKRGYLHSGLLDVDAITLIQKYLDYRKGKTGKPMEIGMPLFLNAYGNHITASWIEAHFAKLEDNAGLKNIGAHELRDLLKSTLIDCRCRADIADHVIGHRPKDSYEKQAKLYPQTIKTEYVKASKKLNIFTKFTSVVNGTDDSDELKAELNDVRATLKQKESEEKRKESAFARHELNIKQQQQKSVETDKKLKELEEKLANINTNSSTKSIEFCCADCSIIHTKEQCPSCGSKIRRIYESKNT